MTLTLTLVAIALAALFVIRSPAVLFDLMVSRSGYTVRHNIAYGSDPRQTLDLYVPAEPPNRVPVILFFYGGGWKSGSKDYYRALGQAFASRGFITVVPDYRIYPAVRFPDFLRDGAAALRLVHQIIGEFRGDPNRIFLAGHSAGAYIAVMLASNPHYVRDAGGEPSWIKGVIGLAGPYDFLPLIDPELKIIFGDDLAATQPINFIDGKKPPMFLATGDVDRTVSPRNTKSLAARLSAVDSPVVEIVYPGVGHIGVILSLTEIFRYKAPSLVDIVRFLQIH